MSKQPVWPILVQKRFFFCHFDTYAKVHCNFGPSHSNIVFKYLKPLFARQMYRLNIIKLTVWVRGAETEMRKKIILDQK